MVSVVIPVYNTEPYLRRCIESVLCSHYEDFELILVDDGSTDGSFRLCTEYAGRDRRVKALSQENQGISAARNRGLEACRGEWVVFVDSDDCISPDFLGLTAAAEPADLLLFDFAETQESLTTGPRTGEALRYGREDIMGLVERVLVPRQLREGGTVNFSSSNGKAFRKSLIDRYGLRFLPKISYGEDKLFNLEYICRIKNCIYLSVPVYFYENRPGSLSHVLPADSMDGFLLLMEKIGNVLKENHVLPAVELAYHDYVLEYTVHALNSIIFSPQNMLPRQERHTMCARLRKSAACRRALRWNLFCGQVQRRIHLFVFGLGWYRGTEWLCALVHYRKRKLENSLPG